jgi:hypothetical protein
MAFSQSLLSVNARKSGRSPENTEQTNAQPSDAILLRPALEGAPLVKRVGFVNA